MEISRDYLISESRLPNPNQLFGATAHRLLSIMIGVIIVSALSTRAQESTKTYDANAGAHWTQANIGLTNLRTKALAVDPNNPSTLFAATELGLFKSIDGGNNWSSSGFADLNVTAIVADPRESKTIYAAILFNGIVKSTDGGVTWRSVGPLHLTINFILVDPRNSNTLYAAYIGASGGGGFLLCKSTDAGESWTFIKAPAYGYLAIDTTNPDILYSGDVYDYEFPFFSWLYKSSDGGKSWSKISQGIERLYIDTLVADPGTPDRLYAGPFSLRSSDGGNTWSSGFTDPSFDRIVADANNSGIRYATSSYNGVYKSNDDGESWSFFNDGLTYLDLRGGLVLSPSNPPTLYAGSLYGGVFRNGSMLTLDHSSYSLEDGWNFRVADSTPNAPMRLIGTSNGTSWEIPAWGMTDAHGNFSASGKFVDGSQGSHTVQVEIGGIMSNVVPLRVSIVKIYVADVNQLYDAVNDPGNVGARIELAANTYTLDASRPNGGRIELQSDMELVGQSGHPELVVIDASALPAASYSIAPFLTGAIRMGRGSNTIEWLTVRGAANASAAIETDLISPGVARVRIAHVVAEGNQRGIDVRNLGPASAGRLLVADLANNVLEGNVVGEGAGIRITNINDATGAVIVATLHDNDAHGNLVGCAALNVATNSARISIKSTADRFDGNGNGCLLSAGST